MSDKIPEQAVQAADKAVDQAKQAAETVKKELSEGTRRGEGGVVKGVKNIDRFLLRLNKLLATPGGLSAFLSTSNYILYILAHFQPRTPSLTTLYARLLSLTTSKSSPLVLASDPTAIPPVAALAQLLSKCRTTLRLLGTLPLYAWLRSLATGPKPGADAVLHRIALAQASSYFTYQVLENICVLADHGVVSQSFIATVNRSTRAKNVGEGTARLYAIAYRFWLAGVSCDFLRLAREAQNLKAKRAARSYEEKAVAGIREMDEREDRRWWMDAVIAGAWFPMALHFSGVTGGVPGWNMGWMGVCGLVAGGERMRGLWGATA